MDHYVHISTILMRDLTWVRPGSNLGPSTHEAIGLPLYQPSWDSVIDIGPSPHASHVTI